jgi:hypothetical protein
MENITKFLESKQIKGLTCNDIEKLSYQDKVILTRLLIPTKEHHNYRFREEIIKVFLGIEEKNKNYNPHGCDTNHYSLKSGKKQPLKNGKYSITNTTTLGEFGRIDKERGHDEKETICAIFTEFEEMIFVLKIKYDDNFKKMFCELRTQKQQKMKGFKNTRDSVKIDFNLIQKYGLNYEIIKQDQKVILNWF